MSLRTAAVNFVAIGSLCLFGCQLSSDKGPKPEIRIDAQPKTLATLGAWTELRQLETQHPYANNYNNTVTVTGSDQARSIKVAFDRFEFESGYDWLVIDDGEGGQLTRHTGDLTGSEVVLEGSQARIRIETDYSVTGWGAKLSLFEQTACLCPENYAPVCGADGQTYSNACHATCGASDVAFEGPCPSDSWIDVEHTLATSHRYSNDSQLEWTVSQPGATKIRAYFSRIDTESGYDFVRVLNGDGAVVHSYSGRHLGVFSPEVAGDTLTVEFISDYSVTGWGFESPSYQYVEGDGALSYELVSLAQLEQDPQAYHDKLIELVAEPRVGIPMCTKMACSDENPCCNRCSAAATVGEKVNLAFADGQQMGCSGNECAMHQGCDPFAFENAGPYALRGRFEVQQFAQRLLIDSFEAKNCARRGCSGQACANGDRITTCDFRPEYACYANHSSCGVQEAGHCGWAPSEALNACLEDPWGPDSPAPETTFDSGDTPLAIPDFPATGITSAIGVLGLTGIPETVFVTLNIGHTYRGDLIVTLVEPSGVETVIHNGTGDGAQDLRLDDQAISYSGHGELNGAWLLKIADRYAQDTGVLENWSLRFE